MRNCRHRRRSTFFTRVVSFALGSGRFSADAADVAEATGAEVAAGAVVGAVARSDMIVDSFE